MKYIFSFFLVLTSLVSLAQIHLPKSKDGGKGLEDIGVRVKTKPADSLRNSIPKLPATDYKLFNIANDTLAVDTTLTIRDAYRFNPMFKDDFTYLSFQNYGQAWTNLAFDIYETNILPGFVAPVKLTDYWTHNQVPFFKTPTPYSDLTYMNGISQGQVVNALFATNINKNLNLAAGYRGLSSLGLYKHSASSSGRFFGSLNYHTNNDRYALKFYYYTYEKDNEENGGISDVEQFENGGDTFKDRSRIDVKLSDAQNELRKRRLYLGHEYDILKNKFKIILQSTYRYNRYYFSQNKPVDDLGESIQTNKAFKDSVYLKEFDNLAGLGFEIKKFKIQSGIRYINQTYGFDSIKELNGQILPQRISYNDLSLDSKMKVHLGKLDVSGKLQIGFTKNIAGYYLEGNAGYELPKHYKLTAQIVSMSNKPDFKYILYQSAYDKFNWYQPDLKNQLTQKLQANLAHKKWGKLTVKQIIINNYTYFGRDSLPEQSAGGVKYSALKYQNDFNYKRWGFSTDLLFQKVLDGQDILSLPAYVVRGTLYYSHYFYQHNLYVQSGVTAKFFEPFFAPAYNPVLADFVVQNQQKIGGYPLVDYFINFKVKRFRFYFKLEHVNTLIDKKAPDYYSAPYYPYRDFSIRFGLRWIFFN